MFRFPFALILLFVCCLSCSTLDKEMISALDKAEHYMEHNPDSSLVLLNTLKLNDISNKRERARYALLKSIALDKNYIDVTDDSLTSIAVAYYSKHGDADERLKAYLYNGRVYENAKEYELAMDNYLSAEEYVKSCKDNIIIGRLYSSKSVLYNTIFDAQSAIEQSRLASTYFLKAGDTTRFFNSLNNAAIIMHNSSSFDTQSLDDYSKQMEEYLERLTPSQKGIYFLCNLRKFPKQILRR